VLTCEVAQAPPNSRVMWGEFITNSGGSIISDNEFILSHPNGDRYRIIHTTATEYHLEIRDVRLSDGGTYVCQNTLAGPPDKYRGEAELVVLASDPNCTNTAPPNGNVLEGQSYTIECLVYYQGGYTPKMTWSGPPPFQLGESPPNPTTVWSGVAYTVLRTMDTRAFQCVTNFTDAGELPDDVASNVPDYEHLYRAPQMFVFWGPKNAYVEPIKEAYVVGEVLTCHSDAWPTAAYQYQNMRTLQFFLTQTFTITPDLLGTNQTMRCQAQNIIQGFVYSANIFTNVDVPVPTTPTTPTTTPSTTTAPAEGDCSHLSGHWRAVEPYADLLLDLIEDGEMGEVIGLFKNESDTVWVEVIGTVKREDYSILGLTAIWPFEQGVTSMAAECHSCHGVDVIIGDGMFRSAADSAMCGEGGPVNPHTPYRFNRANTIRSAVNDAIFDVHNPTRISERLGVTLKKR